MRTLLIVFIVLLFLLTLLSSFGGSIRHAEPFYDEMPAEQMPSMETFEYGNPEPPTYDTFTEMPSADMPPVMESYEEAPQQPSEVNMLQGGMEKLMVPEPFVDGEDAAGAPF